MNRAKYREILDENLLQSTQGFSLRRRLTCQQDNNPKHTAKTMQAWLRDKSLNVLEWPSKSPDLNTTEHLWRDLKIAVQRRSPSAEKNGINGIPKYRCAKLLASIPRRLKAVITAKGASTKYWVKGLNTYVKCDLSFLLYTFAKLSKNLFLLCHYVIVCVGWWGKKRFNNKAVM